MAIVISGTNGIDMGNNPVSNASQIDGVVINENGDNVATTSNLVGFKNYIINGNFDIWQRGTSQTTSGYGSDDRWNNSNIGSTKTHSLIVCTDTERALFNASYFSRTAVASVVGANNFVVKHQHIENVTNLAGKTVTLSFWAKADSAKNIAIEFGQMFGTGGTPSSYTSGVESQLITLSSTWQKFTKTIVIPNIVGKTLGANGVPTTTTYVSFWFDAGSSFSTRSSSLGQQSGTFDIAQVQLEEGSVATPFENRPIGLELSLCQRYYYSMVNSMNISLIKAGGTWGTTSLKFPVRMRVAPTVSLSITYQGDWAGLQPHASQEEYKLYSNNGNLGSCEINVFQADAEL